MQPTVVHAPQMIVANPQQIQQSTTSEHYAAKQAFLLGVAQVIIGVLCIVLQIVATVIDAWASDAVVGVWCGIPYVITGILGILSKNKNRTMITACMVMCILTSVFFVLPLVISSSVGFSHDRDEYYCNTFLLSYTTCPPNPDKDTKVGLNVVLLILSLLEFGATIWASALCCGVLCCGASASGNGTTGIVVTSVAPGQVQTVAGGQQILYVQQPAGTVVSPMQQPKPNLMHQPQPLQQPNPVQMRPVQARPTAPPVSGDYHVYSEIADPPPAYEEPVNSPQTFENYTSLSH